MFGRRIVADRLGGASDPPGNLPSPASPAGTVSDGTVISRPGLSSGESVPPEGSPQFSAG
jgi:hypothetical protein